MVHHIGPTTLEVSQSKVRRCTFWKSTAPMTSFIPLFLRVYSHQESPLVHLLWSGPNTLLIFFVWCGSLSHCSFCKWTRNCKQNNTCTYGHPFIGSSIQPYQSSFGTGPRPPLQLGLGTGVWSAPKCDCCIHTCPKDPHQRGKRTWVWFNQTKQDRCEYTMREHNRLSFLFGTLLESIGFRKSQFESHLQH